MLWHYLKSYFKSLKMLKSCRKVLYFKVISCKITLVKIYMLFQYNIIIPCCIRIYYQAYISFVVIVIYSNHYKKLPILSR